jgi:hypothetical protein
VRSMLPFGAVADLASAADQQMLRVAHPTARPGAQLLIGRCSCDFVRTRLTDTREDERHLRERYRKSGAPRDRVIAALERHRRAIGIRAPDQGWPRALANFVAEHARNAGPTLYRLEFDLFPDRLLSSSVRHVRVEQVLAAPQHWLQEGSASLVSR